MLCDNLAGLGSEPRRLLPAYDQAFGCHQLRADQDSEILPKDDVRQGLLAAYTAFVLEFVPEMPSSFALLFVSGQQLMCPGGRGRSMPQQLP